MRRVRADEDRHAAHRIDDSEGRIRFRLGRSRIQLPDPDRAHHFGRVVQTPDAVLEVWKAEFDGLYAEDRMFMLVMHPQIIGRPSRMKMLEKLIAYIRKHPNLWFARCDEIADTVRPRLAA